MEEEPYVLELVRDLHLNPLRAGLVPDLAALARYRWTGHAVLLGKRPAPWQHAGEVLARFPGRRGRARARYRAFVGEGVPQGRRKDLQGGGLVRSAGGWAGVRELRRGREAYVADERILGQPALVQKIRGEAALAAPARYRRVTMDRVRHRVCTSLGLAPEALVGGGRARALSRARAGIAYLCTGALGRPGRPLAEGLGVRPQSVYAAAARGRAARGHWDHLLDKLLYLATSRNAPGTPLGPCAQA